MKEEQTIQWPKGQTTIYNTLHRKLKIEQDDCSTCDTSYDFYLMSWNVVDYPHSKRIYYNITYSRIYLDNFQCALK